MKINSHKDLHVWQEAMDAAMEVFLVSKAFPIEEKYSLVDQIRRSSRSVAAIIAEAWRKRRYKAAFISKLNEAEAEAGETQTWIEFSVRCNYLDRETAKRLDTLYDGIIGKLVVMIGQPAYWTIDSFAKSPGRPDSRSKARVDES